MFKIIVRYALGLYIIMILNALVKLIIRPLLSQMGGDELLGGYEYFLSIALIGSTIVSFGGKRAWVQWGSRKGNIKQLYLNLTKYLLVLASGSLIVLLASYIYGVTKYILIAWFSVGVISETIVLAGTAIAKSILKLKFEARLLLIRLGLLLVSIIVYWLYIDHTLQNLYITLGTYYLVVALISFLIFKMISLEKESTQNSNFKSFLKFSAILWIIDLASVAHTGLDRIVLKNFFDIGTLGKYGVILTFLLVIEQPCSVINEIILPYFTKKIPDPKEFRKLAFFNIFLFMLLGQIMILLYPRIAPLVFKTDTESLKWVLFIGLVMYILKGFELLQTNLTISAGFVEINRKAIIYSIMLYIPILMFGVIYFKLEGTALARLLYFMFYIMIHYFLARKHFGEMLRKGLLAIYAGVPLSLLSFYFCQQYSVTYIIWLIPVITFLTGYYYKIIPDYKTLMDIAKQ
ncbi:MAG: hypothetical protein JXA60_02615 [Candidatus Coatesbacteria bacterium]|nr:hypothetical protein [Candidatus Coatesbacteria bacterium]